MSEREQRHEWKVDRFGLPPETAKVWSDSSGYVRGNWAASLRDRHGNSGFVEILRLSAALAVAEGERLTLAHGYRELALSAGDLNEDEEVLMALAERIVAEERTKEGSENG